VEKKYNENQLRMVFNALLETNALIKVDEDIYFTFEAYSEAVSIVKDYIKQNKSIVLGQFRDLLGTSRKYAMALLDYFDQTKITKRVEDKRILY
jgi:selenocysteine-specific elongation factor